MNILIIGGSRFVGPLLLERLLKNKHAVTVFNRGQVSRTYKSGVTFIQGDRNKGFPIKNHFDVVVDMCAYTGAQTQQALRDLSFDFFVHFSTVASYQETQLFPITEDSPIGNWPVWDEYNRGKVECEQILAASSIKYAIIRPVYILGSANYMDREQFIYTRIYKGKDLILPGNGQAVCQFVFSRDIADILLFLSEGKIEGAFNCASDELITLKGLVDSMATLVGKPARIRYNPQADGVHFREEEFPFANENLICSNEKFKKLGFVFTPLLRGLKEDFESYYKALLTH